MGEHLHINTEMKVIYYPDTKAQLTRDDIIMIFGEPEAVDQCMEFAASLQRHKLTYEEVAVLKAIIITFRGKTKICYKKHAVKLLNLNRNDSQFSRYYYFKY